MLDLDARVHLHEIELPLFIDEELHRADVLVADRLGELDRRAAHLLAQLVVEERRRGFLDDLLVAPLDGAIALAQVDDAAVAVGDDLELDVARVDDSFSK